MAETYTRIDLNQTQTYEQHASDWFNLKLVPGTDHCGLDYAQGVARMKYTVDLDYSGHRALDGRGFLLDNLVFHEYFNNLPPCDCSCEELARRCAQELVAKLEERVAAVCRCRVRIYPFDDVFVGVTLTGACEL